MKAKTKEEKKIVELHKNLGKIHPKNLKFLQEESFYNLGTTRYSYNLCLECGHKYKKEKKNLKLSTCPSCNKSLKVINIKGKWEDNFAFGIVVDRCKEYQVLRYYQVHKMWEKQKPAKVSVNECMQIWINPKGNARILSYQAIVGMGYFIQRRFDLGSPFEIRKFSNTKHEVAMVKHVCPIRKRSYAAKRNGYKYGFVKTSPFEFFMALLNNNAVETLLKRGEKVIAKDFIESNRYSKKEILWNSLKICFRNNYQIKDFNLWKDLIDFLVELDLDTRSPAYVCPDNLKEAHQKMMKRVRNKRDKIRKQQKKERLEELVKQIRKDSIEYVNNYKDYFDLKFTRGPLTIEFIRSPKQLKKESDLLYHCAFQSQYHKKDNCLMFSGRYKDEVIETMEYNPKRKELVQSRGYENESSKFNKRLINLFNDNKKQVDRITEIIERKNQQSDTPERQVA